MDISDLLTKLDNVHVSHSSSERSDVSLENVALDKDMSKTLTCPEMLFQIPTTLPKVAVDMANILSALAAYGHPEPPGAFAKPVRMLFINQPIPETKSKSVADKSASAESFGEGELDNIKGIEHLAEKERVSWQTKCQKLEKRIQQVEETGENRKTIHRDLLETVESTKRQTMDGMTKLTNSIDNSKANLKALHLRLKEVS